MLPITSHKDLIVWRKAIALASKVYAATRQLPSDERFGLTAQLRRAVVSVPSNIAEGAGRNGAKEFLNFIGISRGSLAELETQLQLVVMLGFAAPDHPAFEMANSTGKLLTGLHEKLSTT